MDMRRIFNLLLGHVVEIHAIAIRRNEHSFSAGIHCEVIFFENHGLDKE